MPKCMICGCSHAKWSKMEQNMINWVVNQLNPDEADQISQMPDEMAICELDWYGMVYSGEEYVWDGVNLLVYNESEEEYVEPTKSVWKPSSPVYIQFEKDEVSKKWQVMPRGGKNG